MNAKGFAYLIMTEDENFPFIKNNTRKKVLPDLLKFRKNTFPDYLHQCRKKDKVNKVDIVGYLLKKGELQKKIGLIEVKDTTSYVAVSRNKVNAVLKKLQNEKLKGKSKNGSCLLSLRFIRLRLRLIHNLISVLTQPQYLFYSSYFCRKSIYRF
jgi:hypothetical protein